MAGSCGSFARLVSVTQNINHRGHLGLCSLYGRGLWLFCLFWLGSPKH